MELIADILMAAGAFGAAAYCIVLSRRLNRFSTLEGGMGGAIAVLSAQVDDMTKALEKAHSAAKDSSRTLTELTGRAEDVAARLELMLASMHDIPEDKPRRAAKPEPSEEAPSDETDPPERKLRFVRRRASRDMQEAAE